MYCIYLINMLVLYELNQYACTVWTCMLVLYELNMFVLYELINMLVLLELNQYACTLWTWSICLYSMNLICLYCMNLIYLYCMNLSKCLYWMNFQWFPSLTWWLGASFCPQSYVNLKCLLHLPLYSNFIFSFHLIWFDFQRPFLFVLYYLYSPYFHFTKLLFIYYRFWV